jgi:hypothetical protein
MASTEEFLEDLAADLPCSSDVRDVHVNSNLCSGGREVE